MWCLNVPLCRRCKCLECSGGTFELNEFNFNSVLMLVFVSLSNYYMALLNGKRNCTNWPKSRRNSAVVSSARRQTPPAPRSTRRTQSGQPKPSASLNTELWRPRPSANMPSNRVNLRRFIQHGRSSDHLYRCCRLGSESFNSKLHCTMWVNGCILMIVAYQNWARS